MDEVRAKLGGAHPILRVEDMVRSLRFYEGVLGFKSVAWGTEDFTRVDRDRSSIFLCRGGQDLGKAWVWVDAGDAEKLHEEVVAKGAVVRLPPTNFFWALETHLEDPDGNVLRFGSDPLSDRPFAEPEF